MTAPILYSFRRCPYAMRARLAVIVSEMRCELREVKLSAKPRAMLAESPKGTVPVMVMPDGEVIDQSIDIMRRVLAAHDAEGWLERDDPALIAVNDGPFKHDLDRYKYPERHDGDPLLHRSSGLDFLRELDARLTRTANLSGEARGMSDAAVMPFVRQFAAVDSEWFAAHAPSHVQDWLSRHLASPLFDAAMVRVPPWAPETPKVMFPH
ncbi:glutathione S-transferase [Novosphingobium sp. fls2-241-R2A-195]|uniref:glutathione S-transferase n=1 Tax=Novosphingobium sp. fls2-241-R2A-195 TaxID=3040296 RepID=UPI00254A662A|nr:glutathione S-transferase [Novosphingobium sp. fls2-241-R2A-195]